MAVKPNEEKVEDVVKEVKVEDAVVIAKEKKKAVADHDLDAKLVDIIRESYIDEHKNLIKTIDLVIEISCGDKKELKTIKNIQV